MARSVMQPESTPGRTDLGFKLNYIRDQVLELYRYSRNEHEQRYCSDWWYYYKHWKNYVDRRVSPDDYKSNIGVGLAFPIVEILHARLMEPWYSDFLIEATPAEDVPPDRGPRIASYINNVLMNRVHRSYAKHSLMKKSALVFGRGVMKPYIRFEAPVSLLKRIPMLIQGKFRVGSKVDWAPSEATQRIDFDYVDPFNWWKNPGVRFLQDADWTFERGYITTSSAKKRQESGEWMKDVEILEQDAIGHDEWMLKRLNLESGYSDQVKAQNATYINPHRWIEFQGRLEIKDTPGSTPRYENVIVTLLDEDKIIKHGKLTTWDGRPGYIEWEPTLDPGSDRPIGVIEPLEDILLEINDYENIAIDNARKIMESPIMIDPLSTKQEKIYWGPGEHNWIRDPTRSVAPVPMKDLPVSFYRQMGFLNDLVQRISGVSDYFGGMNTADTSRLTQTATGMQLMANLSASRFGPLAATLDRDYYRVAAKWIHETSKLWMTKPESVRVSSNPLSPFASVGPDELDTQIDYNFNTRALDPTSDERRAKFVEVMKMTLEMAPYLQAQGYMVDYYELTRMVMEEFDHGQSVAKLVKKIEQAGQMPGAGGQDPMAAIFPGNPAAPPPTAA